RADRTVDQAGHQRFTLGRPAFALEITARDAPGGVELFEVVAGQGQEIDAFFRLLGGDHGRQQFAFPIRRNDGPVGLARYFAGLQDELAPAPIKLNTMDIEHCVCLSRFRRGESHEQDGERLPRTRFARTDTASSDPAMALGPSLVWTDDLRPSLKSAA